MNKKEDFFKSENINDLSNYFKEKTNKKTFVNEKKYKLTENGVKDNENNILIPKDKKNRHWKQYLKWKDEGNIPDTSYNAEEILENNKIQIWMERNNRIKSFMWRIERYESEKRQGIKLTDDINKLDKYVQELRDITSLTGFPWNGVDSCPWPKEPV